LKGLGVEVLAMSTDSRFVHQIWQREELAKMVDGGVPFPMLSDAGGMIGTLYGVYDEAGGAAAPFRDLCVLVTPRPDGIPYPAGTAASLPLPRRSGSRCLRILSVGSAKTLRILRHEREQILRVFNQGEK